MKHVTIEREGSIEVVRMDRPPANALDRELGAELIAAAEELGAAEPGAVVLCGTGRFFSAGLDLKLVPTLGPAEQREMVMGVNRLVAAWTAIRCPVVCAVTGHAIAGGLVLALSGDYRVGARAGKLGLTEVRAGVPYPAGAMTIVRAELSPQAARVLVLEGGLVEPEEALALGLVDELQPPEAVIDRAVAVAGELGELPRETYARVKRQLRGELLTELERIVAEEDDPLLDSWLAPGVEEAAGAQLRRATS